MNLITIDKKLFAIVNQGLSNPFFDYIMLWLREPLFWSPLYVFIASILILNFKKNGILILVFAIITFVLTDQLSAHLIKPYIMRLRPCNDVSLISDIHLLLPCGSGYSFPSAHATNHFGISYFLIPYLTRFTKYAKPLLILWASLVAFAQVYVGLHFPLDVFFGAVLGIIVGSMVSELSKGVVRIPDKI